MIELDRWGIDGDPLNNRNGLQKAIDWAYENNYREVVFPKNANHSHPDLRNGIYILIDDNPNPNRNQDHVMLDLRSDTTYDLNGCTVRVKPNNYQSYTIIRMKLLQNTILKNGSIVGDKDQHDYSAGHVNGLTHEWGYGVFLQGCTNSFVRNVKIYDMTGDGCYMGGLLTSWSNDANIPQSSMEQGAIDDRGKNVEDSHSYRTKHFIDYDMIIGADTFFKDQVKKIAAFPGNPHGYGPMGQFTVRELFFFFYDTNRNLIKKSYALLSAPCDVPDGTKYIRMMFPSDEYGTFTNQSIMLHGCKRSENCFVEDSEIANCRRQGLTVSISLVSGIRNSIVHHIRGTAPESCVDIEDGGHSTEKVFVEGCIFRDSAMGVVAYDGHDHLIRNNHFLNNGIHFTNSYSTGVVFENNTCINGNVYLGRNSTIGGYNPATLNIRNCTFRGGLVSIRSNACVSHCTFVNLSLESFGKNIIMEDCRVLTDDGYKQFRALNLGDIKIYRTRFDLNDRSNYESMRDVELHECYYRGKKIHFSGKNVLKKCSINPRTTGFLQTDGSKLYAEDTTFNLNGNLTFEARDLHFKRCIFNNLPKSVYGMLSFAASSNGSDVSLKIEECSIELIEPGRFTYWKPKNTSKLHLSIIKCKIKNNSTNPNLKITSDINPGHIGYLEVIDTELIKLGCDFRPQDLEEDVTYKR